MFRTAKPTTDRPPATANMTPMIDVVFLLIIFFMLVSSFSSAENVRMDLPQPDNSQAVNTKLSHRVVINCMPASSFSGKQAVYSLGPLRIASLDVLSMRLAAAKAADPELQAVLRADRRLNYAAVRDVMRVIADNDVEMMNIVAHVGDGAAAGR